MSMAVNGSPKQVPIRREELAIVYHQYRFRGILYVYTANIINIFYKIQRRCFFLVSVQF
jgi:hypothetical protein